VHQDARKNKNLWRKQMGRCLGRLGLACILVAASPCIAEPSGDSDNLNLQCYESTSPNGRKTYNVFWIDFKNSIITIGSASAPPNNADDPTVETVSRTVPVTVAPEAFSFQNNGNQEQINRKTGFYSQANGTQERCWKGAMAFPPARF
jgi:hypothetical protein